MEWVQIKEQCEQHGYGIKNNKELTQAANKIIPVGKSAKKNKNGGFKRWCVKKGKKETQKFTGDGLPF